MKKILKSAAFVLALMMAVVVTSNTASAQRVNVSQKYDCGQCVDKICSVLNRLSAQVNKCKTMDQFSAIDFDNLTGGLGIEQIPEECGSYRLTKADKDKINSAWDGVIDSMENKFVEFTGGMLTRQQIKSETDSIRKSFKSAVNRSTTFQDLTDNLSNM